MVVAVAEDVVVNAEDIFVDSIVVDVADSGVFVIEYALLAVSVEK